MERTEDGKAVQKQEEADDDKASALTQCVPKRRTGHRYHEPGSIVIRRVARRVRDVVILMKQARHVNKLDFSEYDINIITEDKTLF